MHFPTLSLKSPDRIYKADTGQQATQDSDAQEKGHKQGEPFDCPVYSLEPVLRLQCRES